jgi:ribosome-associated protein
MMDTPPTEIIRLDHFLKSRSIVGSGGEAKTLIQGGEVRVNGEMETRRGRKLHAGDIVELGGEKFPVELRDA